MADFFPLLSRAIDGLEKNTGENRRALYERARAALVHQLRSVNPPLEESEITRERLALEEAIRQVEAQSIKRVFHNDVNSVPNPPSDGNLSSLRDQALRNFREKIPDGEDPFALSTVAASHEATSRMPAEAVNQFDVEKNDQAFPPPHARSALPQGIDKTESESRLRLPESKRARSSAAKSVLRAKQVEEDHDIDLRLPRDYSRIIRAVILLLVIGGAVMLGYWKRSAITAMIANLRHASTPVTKSQPPQRATAPKIADRIVPSTQDGRAATAPAVAVAQKVVLYEEDSNNPQGKRFAGSAIWRTETVSPGSGLAPELVVRADVEIPEKHMRMAWTIRRNTDDALPASHTVEVIFTLPADFPEGGIGNVPGTLMKEGEQARGVPLAGLAVKVTNGYFLIGLSAADVDKQRNIELLKERDWFDIPIVYASGKRAILALEKGPPGARAFAEAFRAWSE
jgi:hypothetical protein